MVANMSIEEVLRKRGTIILQLKKELEYISEEWGIAIETIEIKNVRILSKTLFDNMQAKYRNALILESETSTLETQKEIEEKRIQFDEKQLEKVVIKSMHQILQEDFDALKSEVIKNL